MKNEVNKCVSFVYEAFEQYVGFSECNEQDTVNKINDFINALLDGDEIIAGSEALKGNLTGWWSREIDEKNRLVYRIEGVGENRVVEIKQCKGHYDDK
jgi:toxin YoeB